LTSTSLSSNPSEKDPNKKYDLRARGNEKAIRNDMKTHVNWQFDNQSIFNRQKTRFSKRDEKSFQFKAIFSSDASLSFTESRQVFNNI
jgi:hypothetical protein